MKNTKKLKLKQRDIAILKLLFEHRFLDTELLWHLLKSDSHLPFVEYSVGVDGKSRPITYGFKKQALSKRLKQLFDSGYVKRHYLTDQPLGRGFGKPRAIYGLGTQSAKILLEDSQIPKNVIRKIVQGNTVQSPFLRHSLELAQFKVTLILACNSSKQFMSITSWQQGESIKMKIESSDSLFGNDVMVIHPDSYFILDIKGKMKRHYFLEIDRGTEPIVSKTRRSSIRRKLLCYFNLYQSLKRKSHTISGFQVLFVVPGNIPENNIPKGRLANLLDELNSNNLVYQPNSLVLATSDKSFQLEEPEMLFKQIWYSKSSINKPLSLLD